MRQEGFLFLREWSDPDGDPRVAMHPLPAALATHHRQLNGGAFSLKEFRRLWGEYARGERRIPESVQARAREIDAEQRAAGFVGDETDPA